MGWLTSRGGRGLGLSLSVIDADAAILAANWGEDFTGLDDEGKAAYQDKAMFGIKDKDLEPVDPEALSPDLD